MNAGKVYLIRNDEGIYKIGFTRRNVEERIKDMQTAHPSKLEKIYEYSSKNGTQLENYLHNLYSHKRVSGEWYELDTNEIQNFLKNCQKYEKNISILKEYGNPFV